jgi:nucleoside-triphosphatase
MPNNFLVTGRPGCGKSSVIKEAVGLLEKRGLRAGGLYCPDVREPGGRVGFKMVDLMTGTERLLAHVDQPTGPRVGKYRVLVENVDSMGGSAVRRALREADFVVIDEIAPMEMHSESFKRAVAEVLDSPKPLLAAIHRRTEFGFIGEVKSRPDVVLFEVTPANRASLPAELAGRVVEALGYR